jgi:hypothetical protein
VSFTGSGSVPPNQLATVPLQAGVFAQLVAALPKKQQQLLVATYWGTSPRQPPPAGGYGAHAVLALRHENGRLYFKNPQYAGSKPIGVDGGTAANPPRRYENSSSTLESIADTDLTQWIYWFFAPDAAII